MSFVPLITSWHASNYTFLWGLTLEEGIQRRLGTMKPAPTVAAMKEITIEQMDDLPESFDSRQKWPGWVEGVTDQGDCGSSWAVSTTGIDALYRRWTATEFETRVPLELFAIITSQMEQQYNVGQDVLWKTLLIVSKLKYN